MSVDFSSTTNPITDTETPMFAPVPSWERSRKKKSGLFSGKTRSVAPEVVTETIATRPVMTSADAAAYAEPLDPTDTSFATAPVYATRPVKKGNATAPIAIAAGLIVLGGLATAGYYATQPHQSGIAQLTPGGEATKAPIAANELAANTAPAATTPAEALPMQAQARAPAVATPAQTPTRVAAVARTRPAEVSRSAEDAGVNTSATLPAGPQPYSGTATAPAPADIAPAAPAAPAWNVPAAAATPAPAPVEAAPAPTVIAPPT